MMLLCFFSQPALSTGPSLWGARGLPGLRFCSPITRLLERAGSQEHTVSVERPRSALQLPSAPHWIPGYPRTKAWGPECQDKLDPLSTWISGAYARTLQKQHGFMYLQGGIRPSFMSFPSATEIQKSPLLWVYSSWISLTQGPKGPYPPHHYSTSADILFCVSLPFRSWLWLLVMSDAAFKTEFKRATSWLLVLTSPALSQQCFD